MKISFADRNQRMLLGLLVLLVLAFVPLTFNLEYTTAAALAVIDALGILSVVILTGYVGQVSLCQATFVGISAFATASLADKGMNYFLAALVGIFTSFFLGVLVGIPALRLRGILLAIVTVGVALSFDKFFFEDPAFGFFNGGLSGFHVTSASIGGLTFDNLSPDHVRQLYWMLLTVFTIITVLVINLHDSGSGRRFRAIRDSELAAATMGVDLTKYKLLGFGIAATVAGVGGAFYPLVQGSVSNGPFSFFASFQLAAIAVLMGIRFIPAAVIGAFFIRFIPSFFNPLQDFLSSLFHTSIEIRGDWFNLILGSLLIFQMIRYPDGVWGDLAERTGHLTGVTGKHGPGRGRPSAPAAAENRGAA